MESGTNSFESQLLVRERYFIFQNMYINVYQCPALKYSGVIFILLYILISKKKLRMLLFGRCWSKLKWKFALIFYKNMLISFLSNVPDNQTQNSHSNSDVGCLSPPFSG